MLAGGHAPTALAQAVQLAASGNNEANTLGVVTVTPNAEQSPPAFAAMTDEPMARTPNSTASVTAEQLTDAGARRLSDVWQFDASASDSYNAIGYWDHVTLRGFVLDARHNFRRDGMPISAETSIGLENKSSVDVLKGTSGIQAGTSAPGGLVNYTVKRPTEANLRTIRLETGSRGGGLLHVDMGGRVGVDRGVGYRLNVASEAIRNHVLGAEGRRHLLALAMDWRLAPGQVLDIELEHSQRRQPGVPGLSLVGSQLPAPNPFTNINRQPWSQQGLMSGLTGSIRYEQALGSDWSWSVHAASQRLKANDFLAYPFGCYDAASGTYFADRYCPNGDFDLYDYRSLDERRTTQALQVQVKGKLQFGGLNHQVALGVLRQSQSDTGQPQADNNSAVGTGNIDALPNLPADPTFADPYTLLHDSSTELFAHDRIQLSPTVSTWLGLRHSRIRRESVRTDGSRATAYSQAFTTPWLALAWQARPEVMVYASVGQGVESAVAPGRSRYTNAGQPLAPLTSRQWELGVKYQYDRGMFGAALFGIQRPRAGDAGTCDVASSCTLQMDGDDQHQGLELTSTATLGRWKLDASTLLLHARRRKGSIDPGLNGQRPTNVPAFVLRAGVAYSVASIPGLAVQTRLSHEGSRTVLPNGSITLPSWTTLDAGLKYTTRLQGKVAHWRVGVSNLLDRRYFRESPYQYSHVYLFPGAPRTWRVGLETSF